TRYLHSFPTRRSSDLRATLVSRSSTAPPRGPVRPGPATRWRSGPHEGCNGTPIMAYLFHPEAEVELLDGIRYYEKQRKGLGKSRSEEHTSELQSLAYL